VTTKGSSKGGTSFILNDGVMMEVKGLVEENGENQDQVLLLAMEEEEVASGEEDQCMEGIFEEKGILQREEVVEGMRCLPHPRG